MASIARDFRISESCLARWLKLADREDGLGDMRSHMPISSLTSVNDALYVSGLWTNYGTVADVLERPGAARALANENGGGPAVASHELTA